MSVATSDNSLPADAPEAPDEWKRILEAVLLSAREPLSLAELRKVFADRIAGEVLRALLDELRAEWRDVRSSCCRWRAAGVFGRAPSICPTWSG
jgi:hypothetical protein